MIGIETRFVGLKVILPRRITFAGKREFVFCPSVAFARIEAENERMAKELFKMDAVGVYVQTPQKRSVVTRPKENKKAMRKAYDKLRYKRNRLTILKIQKEQRQALKKAA